jgi:hypothetical protein
VSWVRLDDQFADHPKVTTAGPLAGWLYVCGLLYAARYLTDGFIPTAHVARLAALPTTRSTSPRLTTCGPPAPPMPPARPPGAAVVTAQVTALLTT